ncbi:K(+)/H(+) antiporter NhaP2 [Fibrobacterales bacterium]|nr:K(+)/H(+) antiporter NhaP2 [Fibrobacterales bacterium]
MEHINLIYMVVSVVLFVVVTAAVRLDKFSVPVILVALVMGILLGNGAFLDLWNIDSVRTEMFDRMKLINDIANLALIFILFHGGFGTRKEDFLLVKWRAGGLATWGVVLTATFSFTVMHFVFGMDKNLALLLSVIISSTDAAATFSILRGHSLDKKLSSTIEIESAANDPMAFLLTVVTVQMLASGDSVSGFVVLDFLRKFFVGPLIGFAVAKFAAWLVNKLTPQDSGYYYILFLGTALFSYSFAELCDASGMLSAFTAGFILGNTNFVHKKGMFLFSSSVSTIANIFLFVMLGVLVQPKDWLSRDSIVNGVCLFLVLTFIARPLAVFVGTFKMGIPFKDKIFISWAGLRGAVPIVLATYPMAAGLENGIEIFNLVFFAVLLSVIFQGVSLGKIASLLKLSKPSRPTPPYSLEFFTMSEMTDEDKLELFTIDLPDPEGSDGPVIKDLRLPDGALLIMITRKRKIPRPPKHHPKTLLMESRAKRNVNREKMNDIWQVLPPRGDTVLKGWDQVTVLAKAKDEEKIREILCNTKSCIV